jgi:hypothetical protein
LGAQSDSGSGFLVQPKLLLYQGNFLKRTLRTILTSELAKEGPRMGRRPRHDRRRTARLDVGRHRGVAPHVPGPLAPHLPEERLPRRVVLPGEVIWL